MKCFGIAGTAGTARIGGAAVGSATIAAIAGTVGMIVRVKGTRLNMWS